jgi:lipid-binding SYLF domain-containing protein
MALGAVLTLPARPAAAASEPHELVEKAKFTVERILTQTDYKDVRDWVRKAKGVLVVPSLLKAGFVIGGEGGSGVLLSRDPQRGWSDPAFYTLGAGSIGLQIGFQDSQVLFVIMTDKGLEAMLDKQVKLGADASIAAGAIGAGVEGATTANLGADIYSYSMTRGAFGGASFEGAVAVEREDWNRIYYGTDATPRDIVITRKVTNPHAAGLRRALEIR